MNAQPPGYHTGEAFAIICPTRIGDDHYQRNGAIELEKPPFPGLHFNGLLLGDTLE
jgi:hypothetical protein